MLLSELGTGQKFKVMSVAFGGEIGKRLADLGFISGVEGEVVRTALFRGPMQVRLGDYDLIMRRHEARLVDVEVLAETSSSNDSPKAFIHIDLRDHFRHYHHHHQGFGRRPRGI